MYLRGNGGRNFLADSDNVKNFRFLLISLTLTLAKLRYYPRWRMVSKRLKDISLVLPKSSLRSLWLLVEKTIFSGFIELISSLFWVKLEKEWKIFIFYNIILPKAFKKTIRQRESLNLIKIIFLSYFIED